MQQRARLKPVPAARGRRPKGAFPGVQPAIQGGEIRVRAEAGVHAGDGHSAALTPPAPLSLNRRGGSRTLFPLGEGRISFQHHMRVCPAKPEGTDPSAARAGERGPGREGLHAARAADLSAL